MTIEGVVKPESIAQVLCKLALLPLLPVEPPEVDTNILKRAQNGLKVGIRPLLLVNLKRNALALLCPAILLYKSLIWLLKWLNTRSRVEVKRCLKLL